MNDIRMRIMMGNSLETGIMNDIGPGIVMSNSLEWASWMMSASE